MKHLLLLALALAIGLLLGACTETTGSLGSVPTTSGESAAATAPAERLTKHDAALRFLTAYIRQDRNMALQFATPQAVSKLDWNVPHRGNIPYYDDKMLLQFSGGWARVYFQEVNGSFIVSDLDVHRR